MYVLGWQGNFGPRGRRSLAARDRRHPLLIHLLLRIGVTTRDRPAAAPQTGDYDLGYHIIGNPTFDAGITSVATIFCSGAGTSAFLPVISEMRWPRDYSNAVYLCMSIVTACLYILAAKYLFLRILRNSRHLQDNSIVYWSVWLACAFSMSVVAFLLASGIPIFSYLLALAGSLPFAPRALGLPGYPWIYNHQHYSKGDAWQITMYWASWLLILPAAFLTVGGTYGVIQNIIDAYASGLIGGAFSCADNSNSSQASSNDETAGNGRWMALCDCVVLGLDINDRILY